ncbi:MAG: alpha-galactosidase [Planctomycetes bacterium]|nr:alpha-galactosidase [Planctomycetota bacterium]
MNVLGGKESRLRAVAPVARAVPRRALMLAPALVFAVLWGAASSATARAAEEDLAVLEGGAGRVEFDPADGRWSWRRADGEWVLRGAWAEAELAGGARARTTDGARASRRAAVRDHADDHGRGRMLKAVCAAGADGRYFLEWTAIMYEGRSDLLCRLAISNQGGGPLAVGALAPVIAAASGDPRAPRGLVVGADARRAQVLENGHGMYFDFDVRILSGDHQSPSNWNHAVWAKSSRDLFTAGFLTHDAALTQLRAAPGKAGGDLFPGGRRSFASYAAECRYLPRKGLPPGGRLAGETLRLYAARGDVFGALEDFGRAVAAFHHRPARPPADVPDGWNSWGGGAGSGGQGQAITEGYVLENLAFAERHYRPYGLRNFQIDDGWQVGVGDWTPDPVRFPNGLAPVARAIARAGFAPGLWIAPFMVSRDSALFREHPEWLAKKGFLGLRLSPRDWEPLDLTRPEVKQWLARLFERVTREWGFRFIKLDFAYWAALSEGHFDPAKSSAEAFHDGLRVVRDAIGPNVHLLTVGMLGTSFDVADSFRLSLDNQPDWEGRGRGMGTQGLKPTYRTFARRYYLHGTLWANHPDLLFFREPLTTDEATAFATAVGLSGGIVKLGERFTDMDAARRRVHTRFLPVHGVSGRPRDLFEREFPEVWRLPIEASGEKYDLIGLFNWGRNVDLNTGQAMPEAARVHRLSPAALGLPAGRYTAFEFWRGQPLGDVDTAGDANAAYDIPLQPRTCALVALRPALDRPHLLSWDRHFTQGAECFHGQTWNGDANRLTLAFETVAGESGRLWLRVPPPFRLARAAADGLGEPSVAWSDATSTVCIVYPAPRANVEARMTLVFTRAAGGVEESGAPADEGF